MSQADTIPNPGSGVRLPPDHSATAFKTGRCRCEICRGMHNEARAAARAKRRQAVNS